MYVRHLLGSRLVWRLQDKVIELYSLHFLRYSRSLCAPYQPLLEQARHPWPQQRRCNRIYLLVFQWWQAIGETRPWPQQRLHRSQNPMTRRQMRYRNPLLKPVQARGYCPMSPASESYALLSETFLSVLSQRSGLVSVTWYYTRIILYLSCRKRTTNGSI